YPEVMQWIDDQANLSSVTGLTSNAVLKEVAREVVEQAKRAYERDGGKVTRFHSTRYQAGTWSRWRRVVIKVAVSDQGVTTRLVKLGARVQELTDRIKISLPSSCPVAPVLRRSLTL